MIITDGGNDRRITALKIETQPLEDHQVKLRVEADPAQLEEAKRRAARRIAKNTKISGFRPGKAPYHIIERNVGEAVILEEAIELLVKDIYPKALEESGIDPYGPGQLEDISTEDQVTFEFVVPLRAEVTLGDYKDLREEYLLEPVQEEEVEGVVEHLRGQGAILEPVERPAQEGDQVQVIINAEFTDEEGQTKSLLKDMPFPAIIKAEDEQDKEEFPYLGFSRQISGMSAGEEKEFSYTYPEDASFEALRGKEATFHIKVDNVKSRELPEVDDDFAAAQGSFENADAMRSTIRERIEERQKGEFEQDYGENLLTRLVEEAEIKYPPQMLDDEIESILRDLEHRLSHQNMDMETYLKTRTMDMDALREELRPQAEQRLKRMLVLMELGRREDIQVSSDEVQSGTIQTIQSLYENLDAKQIRRQLNEDTIRNITSNVTADLLMKNTMNRLIAIGKGEGDQVEESREPEGQDELEAESSEPEAHAELSAEEEADLQIEPDARSERISGPAEPEKIDNGPDGLSEEEKTGQDETADKE
jgi:trigger factor